MSKKAPLIKTDGWCMKHLWLPDRPVAPGISSIYLLLLFFKLKTHPVRNSFGVGCQPEQILRDPNSFIYFVFFFGVSGVFLSTCCVWAAKGRPSPVPLPFPPSCFTISRCFQISGQIFGLVFGNNFPKKKPSVSPPVNSSRTGVHLDPTRRQLSWAEDGGKFGWLRWRWTGEALRACWLEQKPFTKASVFFVFVFFCRNWIRNWWFNYFVAFSSCFFMRFVMISLWGAPDLSNRLLSCQTSQSARSFVFSVVGTKCCS